MDDQPVFVAAQIKDDPIITYEVDGATKLPLYLDGIFALPRSAKQPETFHKVLVFLRRTDADP